VLTPPEGGVEKSLPMIQTVHSCRGIECIDEFDYRLHITERQRLYVHNTQPQSTQPLLY